MFSDCFKKVRVPFVLVTLLVTCNCCLVTLHAQNVGIGSSSFTPDAASMLEIQSTTSGLLIPRMTEAQRTAIAATTNSDYGLLVYQTNNDSGFYYWNGAAWLHMLDQKTGWLTEGNAGTNKSTHFLGTTDDENLVFKTNNIQHMVLDSNGRVGIGTTSPLSQLHIKEPDVTSTNAATIILEGPQQDASSSFPQVMAEIHFTSDENAVPDGVTDVASIKVRATKDFNPSNYASEMAFFTTPSGNTALERIIIKNDGNVGIGTTSPLGKFHVNNDDVGSDSSFVVMESGRVGIGTTSPQEMLEVIGTLQIGVDPDYPGQALLSMHNSHTDPTDQFYAGINFDISTGFMAVGGGSSMNLFLDAGETMNYGNHIFRKRGWDGSNQTFNEVMRIDSAGNVGIGTTTPSATLEVTSSIKVSSSANAELEIVPTFGVGASIIDFTSSGSSTQDARIASGVGSVSNIIFYTGGAGMTERMRIMSNGNTGIGTSTPEALLHVSSGGNGIAAKFERGGAPIVEIVTGSNNVTSGYINWIENDDDTAGSIGVHMHSTQANYMHFDIEQDEKMRITEAGDIGIGTTNPRNKLEVLGGPIRVGVNTAQSAFLGADGSGVGYVGTLTNHFFQIRPNSTTAATFLTNGNVGIGTASPSENLDVVGNTRLRDSVQIGDGDKIAEYLSKTTTWDPASIADGTLTTTTVTVTGAAVGDLVTVGHNQLTTAGVLLNGQVTAANTVTVNMLNHSGGAFDLSSGTLRVGVWRH